MRKSGFLNLAIHLFSNFNILHIQKIFAEIERLERLEVIYIYYIFNIFKTSEV